jgi:hypothetical protein
MRKLRLTGVAGLVVVASMIPVASADAKQSTTGCPKKWQPAPEAAAPPNNRDHNDNDIVCVKGPQGHNGHFNVKDDNNQTVSPVLWSTLLIDETSLTEDVFIVIDNLALFPGFYHLDPTPEDITDDVPQ